MRRAQTAQLFDRRGAKGVARREHDRLAFGAQLRRELADGRRLARPVDADDQDHERPLRRIDDERTGDRLERPLDLVRQHRLHRLRVDPPLVAPACDRVANARGGGDAEVGLDENILEVVERLGVELALGEDVADAAPDAAATTA